MHCIGNSSVGNRQVFKLITLRIACLLSFGDTSSKMAEYTDFIPEFVIFDKVTSVHDDKRLPPWPAILEYFRLWIEESGSCRICDLDMTTFTGNSVTELKVSMWMRNGCDGVAVSVRNN